MKDAQSIHWRYWWLMALLSLAFAGLLWRTVDLMLWQRSFLMKQGEARAVRTINLPAYRGLITDRDGKPLAISIPMFAVWINPQDFAPSRRKKRQLQRLLHGVGVHLPAAARLQHSREFTYLARAVSPEVAKKIQALAIPGLFISQEYHRYYPEAEVFSHVLGFTNIDDQGQEGLELAFDDWLAGVPGKKQVIKDRQGHVVAEMPHAQLPKPGHNLQLTVDRRIQTVAYHALQEAVAQYQAEGGSAVVLDVKGGELLAMVNQPGFNPNQRRSLRHACIRNRSISDLFEPGSVMKAFTIAYALASEKFNPLSRINTSPGSMIVDGYRIRDHHDYGRMTVEEILQRSSNVGVSKILLTLPAADFMNFLNQVGFGKKSMLHLPGETAGSLPNAALLRPFVYATVGFGYGISVTALQLAQAYSVFANDGKLVPVSLIKHEQSQNTAEQILAPSIARTMVNLLQTVVHHGGTGTKAQIAGYQVAGKTGTARIALRHGYRNDQHVATFVGLAPASRPRLVVCVVIRNPRQQYYGGQVSAPVFAKIMRQALHILHIPPDNITELAQRRGYHA